MQALARMSTAPLPPRPGLRRHRTGPQSRQRRLRGSRKPRAPPASHKPGMKADESFETHFGEASPIGSADHRKDGCARTIADADYAQMLGQSKSGRVLLQWVSKGHVTQDYLEISEDEVSAAIAKVDFTRSPRRNRRGAGERFLCMHNSTTSSDFTPIAAQRRKQLPVALAAQ